MKKILFIVNPRSEKKRGVRLENIIGEKLDLSKFEYTLVYSEYHRHAFELARDKSESFQLIVAAGGDGTVNQVAEALAGSKIPLGIIPLGSGNGLAYDLGIPKNISASVLRINKFRIRTIDSALIGGNFFINIAGIGFDAEIAHDFEDKVNRGLSGYVSSVIRKFFGYHASSCILSFDNREIDLNPFLVSFANTGQYGNNAYISPSARPDDGFIDICVLRRFPVLAAPFLALRLFLRNIDRSRYYKSFRVKEAMISGSDTFKGHIDGEAIALEKEFNIVTIPHSLEVIV